MMLEQIERHLETKMQEAQAAAKPKAKTVGVKVEPDLYAKLQEIKERHKLRSLKDALIMTATIGVKHLEATKSTR
jgi:wyosine [tRNA(Phe)-imidazoG37] synthetase (radical SAM superfamily)